MTYVIEGIDPAPFRPLLAADEADLAAALARRVTATGKPGFPCRVTLEDVEPGETLLLVHHVSRDALTPYRSAYAIYVREEAGSPARYVDAVPPVMERRALALRGFSADAMLHAAALAAPGEADAAIRAMLADPAIATIDVHNAAHGCFVARVGRSAA